VSVKAADRPGREQDTKANPSANANRADRAVYVISVAAELTGMHPQTLRIYERKGLLDPRAPAAGAGASPTATCPGSGTSRS
jgi:hypothetical protein